jgi:hypothetical protein
VSFIYKLYSVGTRTEPCGTHASISLDVDSSPTTTNFRSRWNIGPQQLSVPEVSVAFKFFIETC